MKTIVGLYKTVDQANKVKAALTSEGYEAEHITVIDQTDQTSNASGTNFGSGSSYATGSDTTGAGATNYNTGTQDPTSVGSRIKNFFGSLTGSDEAAHNSYTQGVTNGGALLAVTVADEDAEETADILHQHGASEIEGGYGDSGSYGSGSAANYGTTGTSNYATGTGAEDVAVLQGNNANRATGEQVIPVVEEELQVGKRQVERGGVRIYSRVVSEPVSESVSLHNERVVVDRRTVDRPATDADFTTGSGVVEVRAQGEEAVVGKRSRVVEEILVGKEASDRTQEINDTVRHTEVDVEETAGETTGTTSGTTTAGSTGFNR